jgi:hypothetical protein
MNILGRLRQDQRIYMIFLNIKRNKEYFGQIASGSAQLTIKMKNCLDLFEFFK